MPEPLDVAAMRAIVDEQAEDDGLWFVATTAVEAYLQQELRRLHAVIEAEPAFIAALESAIAQLDAEHRPDSELRGCGGCVMCWPKDGRWPCVTRMIADELRAATGVLVQVGSICERCGVRRWHDGSRSEGALHSSSCGPFPTAPPLAEPVYVIRSEGGDDA